MVSGLDEKLKSNPNNFDGWVRLIRSYTTLMQGDKALDALDRALKIFQPIASRASSSCPCASARHQGTRRQSHDPETEALAIISAA